MAVEARDEHVDGFYSFTDTIPVVSVLEWTSMVEAWEMDDDECNPFVPTIRSKPLLLLLIMLMLTNILLGVTQHDVRLSLAQLDDEDLEQDNIIPVHEEITPGIFIGSGLDLEAQQYITLHNSYSLAR